MKILPISWFNDYLPEKYRIFDTMRTIIKETYAKSGFIPFETPALERIETLLSKWWDDNEIYGVHRLNWEKEKAELALRFDLTVPLARYIAQYEGELKFPFKRQHIDRSWRGERAQTGRSREFYQADIDIIGRESLSLLADVEVIETIYTTLSNLDFWEFKIHLNNKKILIWFLEAIGIDEKKHKEVISIIDKKEKLKLAGKDIQPFFTEFIEDEKIIKELLHYISFSEKEKTEIMTYLRSFSSETLFEGIKELDFIYENLVIAWVKEQYIHFDNTISRGLNYYTGTTFETFLSEAPQYGSIASWGRYENLIGNFSKNSYPWVGGSIGLTRLFQILETIGKFDEKKFIAKSVLIINFDEKYLTDYLKLNQDLKEIGFISEVYLDAWVKMKKQMDYANAKGIEYVIMLGEEEIKAWKLSIKNLKTGEQEERERDKFKKYFF